MSGDFDAARLKLLSFDVFGTLISVREGSYGAFARILRSAAASHLDVKAFWEAWEERNITGYWAPYRPYKAICRQSLADTFAAFGVKGDPDSIAFYFDAFARFELYPDVVATLERLSRRFKLAVVSNIDDDLLAATPLQRVSISFARPSVPRATNPMAASFAISWPRPPPRWVSASRRFCIRDSRSSRIWWGPSRSAFAWPGSIAGACR